MNDRIKAMTEVAAPRGRRPRKIALPDCIFKMCLWLKTQSNGAEPHVFLNDWGRPYTKDRLVKCMDRVRKRAGIDGSRYRRRSCSRTKNRRTMATSSRMNRIFTA